MQQSYTLSPFESRTFDGIDWLDYEPKYRLKTRHFLDGTVDFIMSSLKPKKLRESTHGTQIIYPKNLTDEELESKRLENIERSARRAKQCVHHLVRQIAADHMLTLTTRENITDRDKFYEIFSRFIRLVREKYLIKTNDGLLHLAPKPTKTTWHYVACHELQERGAYHMHVACVGRQDLQFLRSCWYQALGGSPNDKASNALGQIDLQQSKKRWSGLSEVHKTFKLVGYLTKYISKSFADTTVLGTKRYSSSRLVPKPITHKQYLVATFSCPIETFTKACQEVFSIADFMGVKDLSPWNNGLDIFILRGTF